MNAMEIANCDMPHETMYCACRRLSRLQIAHSRIALAEGLMHTWFGQHELRIIGLPSCSGPVPGQDYVSHQFWLPRTMVYLAKMKLPFPMAVPQQLEKAAPQRRLSLLRFWPDFHGSALCLLIAVRCKAVGRRQDLVCRTSAPTVHSAVT